MEWAILYASGFSFLGDEIYALLTLSFGMDRTYVFPAFFFFEVGFMRFQSFSFGG